MQVTEPINEDMKLYEKHILKHIRLYELIDEPLYRQMTKMNVKQMQKNIN